MAATGAVDTEAAGGGGDGGGWRPVRTRPGEMMRRMFAKKKKIKIISKKDLWNPWAADLPAAMKVADCDWRARRILGRVMKGGVVQFLRGWRKT